MVIIAKESLAIHPVEKEINDEDSLGNNKGPSFDVYSSSNNGLFENTMGRIGQKADGREKEEIIQKVREEVLVLAVGYKGLP